jgi:hypothetical protein
MRWVGDHDPPDEPPESVPEVGGDWQATPWRACTICGYAEGEGLIGVGIPDDLLPGDGTPTSG